jgi:prepilin-type N-terminal cleavage/methylation domain-containing protein
LNIIKTTVTDHTRAAKRTLARGFTIIEFLVVVAIAALLLYGVVAFLSPGQASAKAEATADSFNRVSTKIKGKFRNGNYTGLTCGTLAADGALAGSTFIVNGTGVTATVTHDLGEGGPVLCAPANVGAGTNNGFVFTLQTVPTQDCKALLEQAAKLGGQITVGSTIVKAFTDATSTSGAGAACEASPTVSIALTQTR